LVLKGTITVPAANANGASAQKQGETETLEFTV
jgi:hypothetical protein